MFGLKRRTSKRPSGYNSRRRLIVEVVVMCITAISKKVRGGMFSSVTLSLCSRPSISGQYLLIVRLAFSSILDVICRMNFNTNHLTDSTGGQFAEGQIVPVWFVAGTTGRRIHQNAIVLFPVEKLILFLRRHL